MRAINHIVVTAFSEAKTDEGQDVVKKGNFFYIVLIIYLKSIFSYGTL